MNVFLRLILYISLLVYPTNALKVLLYQTALGKSHLHFSGALVDELVKSGHIVDQYIVRWNRFPGYGSTNARKSYDLLLGRDSAFEVACADMNAMDKVDLPVYGDYIIQTRREFAAAMLNDTETLSALNAEKYDVGLSATFDANGFALFHILGIKTTVGYTPTAEYFAIRQTFGIPNAASFVPSSAHDNLVNTDSMTFAQRVVNFVETALLPSRFSTYTDSVQHVFREYDPAFPSLADLFKRQSFSLINSHPILDIPKGQSHKVVQIGGITMPKMFAGNGTGKALPESVSQVLAAANKGTVFFSFGSFAKTGQIPVHVLHGFARAFARFPEYNFIWKVDDVTVEADYYRQFPNVFRFEWLPQADLLRHPALKLFITHAGQNSFMEASLAGLPVVAVPLFADQFYNAGCFARNGAGVVLDKNDLSEAAVVDALRRVLGDPRYAQNARTVSEMARNYPHHPARTFVQTVEYAARYPELSQHLQLEGANLHWVVYHSLDVVAFLFSVAFIFTVALYWTCLRIQRYSKVILKAKQQ